MAMNEITDLAKEVGKLVGAAPEDVQAWLDFGDPVDPFIEPEKIAEQWYEYFGKGEEPPEFPFGEFPNYYEITHNMTLEFIEQHRHDYDRPGEPEDFQDGGQA